MTLPADTLPAIARWLANPARLEKLRHHDLALTFHDEIKVAVERCRQVIDRPQDREAHVPAGLHQDCGGQVTGHLPPEGEGATTLTCDCGKTWTAAEFRTAGRHLLPDDARPVWISTFEAGLLLGVKDSTVRYHVSRGRLAFEYRARGRRRVLLVRKADVLDLRLAG